jgi:5'-3' exonuclease
MKLVIDGNSLLSVVASVAIHTSNNQNLERPFFRVQDKLIIKDDASEYYNAQLYKYLSSILFGLSFVDNIYIAVDSVSWRKFYFKKYAELFKARPDYKDFEIGYKGHRKTDTENKEQLKELVKYLSNETLHDLARRIPGIQIISVKGLEGDDIVYTLANRFKKEDDVIVWTNDSDIHQIIDSNVYVIGSNDHVTKKRKLFRLKQNVNLDNTSNMCMNFDFKMNGIDKVFDDLLKRGIYIENISNPKYEIFSKIICGDKSSDNIPSVFCKDVGDKLVNVTKVRHFDKVYNFLIQEKKYTDDYIISKLDQLDFGFFKEVADKLCDILKLNSEDFSKTIVDCINFNTRLIRLSHTCIPEDLMNYLESIIDENQKYTKQFNNSIFYEYIGTKKYMKK